MRETILEGCKVCRCSSQYQSMGSGTEYEQNVALRQRLVRISLELELGLMVAGPLHLQSG